MKEKELPVFILCGGKGTRISEESIKKPKPRLTNVYLLIFEKRLSSEENKATNTIGYNIQPKDIKLIVVPCLKST